MLSEDENNSSLQSLVLAQHDIPETLVIPQKLYGRDSETANLFEVFKKACAGSFELFLITGSSGKNQNSSSYFVIIPTLLVF